MVTSTTEVVIIILSIILIFAIVSACCRGLSRAYVRHLESEEMARRRLAFNLDPASGGIPNPNSAQRAVRVTTISREGDTIAMGVYEIHMPRSAPGFPNRSRVSRPRVMAIPPPPPFSTAYQVSSPVGGVPELEEPPPSYDEYMKIHATCDLKLNKEQNQQQQRY